MILTNADIGHFLIALAATAAVVTGVFAGQSRFREFGFTFLVLLVLLALAVGGVALAVPGENVVLQTVQQTFRGGRTLTIWLASALFLGAMSGVALATTERVRAIALLALFSGGTGCLGLLCLKDKLSGYLENPTATGASGFGIQRSAAAGFQVEEIATLTALPTSIVVDPAGRIFVAGYAGIAMQNGVVLCLTKGKGNEFEVKTAANCLNRPHGLALHDGDLYVSRAGQFNRAISGKMIQESTGVVTRMRDLDEDGVFDFYEDILTGLPGAQHPDGLHQNNGIAFDPQGRLYVTVGAPSDHGPFNHPLAGTIVRWTADAPEPYIFARGLRNPFDIAFGPDGELFGTDNDENDTNEGDELNHLREGKHYGFPYASKDGLQVEGVVPPIARLTSAQGIVYVPKGAWPDSYDDCLYVASYADGNINRVRLKRKGETYEATVDFLAHVPFAIDLAFSDDKVMYACDHHGKKLYRISPTGK